MKFNLKDKYTCRVTRMDPGPYRTCDYSVRVDGHNWSVSVNSRCTGELVFNMIGFGFPQGDRFILMRAAFDAVEGYRQAGAGI